MRNLFGDYLRSINKAELGEFPYMTRIFFNRDFRCQLFGYYHELKRGVFVDLEKKICRTFLLTFYDNKYKCLWVAAGKSSQFKPAWHFDWNFFLCFFENTLFVNTIILVFPANENFWKWYRWFLMPLLEILLIYFGRSQCRQLWSEIFLIKRKSIQTIQKIS